METTHPPGGAAAVADDMLLDYQACARRLGTSKSFVERLVAERRVPYLKLGHYVRIRNSDLDAYLAESRVPAAWETS